jgi:hypothetical protein
MSVMLCTCVHHTFHPHLSVTSVHCAGVHVYVRLACAQDPRPEKNAQFVSHSLCPVSLLSVTAVTRLTSGVQLSPSWQVGSMI